MVDEFTNNRLRTPLKTTTELLSRDYSTPIKRLHHYSTTAVQDAHQQNDNYLSGIAQTCKSMLAANGKHRNVHFFSSSFCDRQSRLPRFGPRFFYENIDFCVKHLK